MVQGQDSCQSRRCGRKLRVLFRARARAHLRPPRCSRSGLPEVGRFDPGLRRV